MSSGLLLWRWPSLAWGWGVNLVFNTLSLKYQWKIQVEMLSSTSSRMVFATSKLTKRWLKWKQCGYSSLKRIWNKKREIRNKHFLIPTFNDHPQQMLLKETPKNDTNGRGDSRRWWGRIFPGGRMKTVACYSEVTYNGTRTSLPNGEPRR